MITIYIVSALIGVVLAIMAAFGALEHAHDLDFQGDVTAPHGTDTWIPFLSLRFWTYAFGGFGLTGVLLSYLTDLNATNTLGIAIATGVVCGLGIAVLVRAVSRSEAQSNSRADDLVGLTAKVLVTVRKAQPGRIRCHVKGEILDVLAVAEEDVTLHPGEDAIVVCVEEGRATVVPLAALSH